MKTTTLNKIKEQQPTPAFWKILLKSLGKTEADDENLSFLTILESNGFDDALWCMRSAPEYDKEWRLFGVWCARQVQQSITDKRSVDALNVAERFANGLASQEELESVKYSANDAAIDAESFKERCAARAAAWASASYAEGAVSGSSASLSARKITTNGLETQKAQFIKVIK